MLQVCIIYVAVEHPMGSLPFGCLDASRTIWDKSRHSYRITSCGLIYLNHLFEVSNNSVRQCRYSFSLYMSLLHIQYILADDSFVYTLSFLPKQMHISIDNLCINIIIFCEHTTFSKTVCFFYILVQCCKCSTKWDRGSLLSTGTMLDLGPIVKRGPGLSSIEGDAGVWPFNFGNNWLCLFRGASLKKTIPLHQLLNFSAKHVQLHQL